jgi:hypothetical protein
MGSGRRKGRGHICRPADCGEEGWGYCKVEKEIL